MRALEKIHDVLRSRTQFVHATRWRAVWRVAQAAIRSERLWLTALGRALPTSAFRKHAIKAVDRLLGNQHLYDQRFAIAAALASFVIPRGSRPVLLVDTMEIRHGVVAFSAALQHDGRSIPIWSTIVTALRPPVRDCRRFLRELARIVPPSCIPILVTDGGFESAWFEDVQKLNWDYVGRIRGQVKIQRNGEWLRCPELHRLATRSAKDLGELFHCLSHPRLRRFVLSKKPVCRHRQLMTRTGPSRDTNYLHYRKNAYEPLLLTTSLKSPAKRIVKLYSSRMSIEELFRDIKNHRWGWSLRHCRTRSRQRLEILLLVAAIAIVTQQLVGMAGERLGLHRRHQANTVRNIRVLSFFALGGMLLNGEDLRLVTPCAVLAAIRQVRSHTATISAGM